jgi:hypothetical protein
VAVKNATPFGVSVAFLAGVSAYDSLSPQLPFVKNDVEGMRQFLLVQGGFDTVYAVTERLVNRDLIDEYMLNRFVKWLKPKDRLLFYYAGHGADNEGRTGFMQFASARPNNFAGSQVQAINSTLEWSEVIKIRHLLFLFDCCASGLAFSARGELDKITTLTRDSSRIALTAGTGEQQTYEQNGHDVFTRAFLNATTTGIADKGDDGLLTVDEIFAYIKDEIATYAARNPIQLTPQPWQLLDRVKYRGTFIFINPEAQRRNLELSDENAQALNAQPRGSPVAQVGIIRLTSYLTGQVYLDNVYMGEVESGDVRDYENVNAGAHTIAVKSGSEIATKTITVAKGKTTSVTLRLQQAPPAVSPPVENKPASSTSASRYVLRATKRDNLSEADVKAMLRQNSFYCHEYDWSKAYSNPQGQGLPNEFELSQDRKVVFDRATGLMWQQGGSPEPMRYDKVNAYLEQLNRGNFAGHDDWRLPTLEEAMSLMEPKQLNGDLYINSKFDAKQRWIWTADMYTASAAWVVFFYYGYCYHYDVDFISGYPVRAVRSGKSSSIVYDPADVACTSGARQ